MCNFVINMADDRIGVNKPSQNESAAGWAPGPAGVNQESGKAVPTCIVFIRMSYEYL